jgi:hypothetical protein
LKILTKSYITEDILARTLFTTPIVLTESSIHALLLYKCNFSNFSLSSFLLDLPVARSLPRAGPLVFTFFLLVGGTKVLLNAAAALLLLPSASGSAHEHICETACSHELVYKNESSHQHKHEKKSSHELI